MTESKYTPGPWLVRGDCREGIQGGDGFNVCDRIYDDPHADREAGEAEANARLIAAAPDLAEALLRLIPFAAGEELRQAKAALAKAGLA